MSHVYHETKLSLSRGGGLIYERFWKRIFEKVNLYIIWVWIFWVWI